MVEIQVYATSIASAIPIAVYWGMLAVLVIGVIFIRYGKCVRSGWRQVSKLLLVEWGVLVLCATVVFRSTSAERGFRLIPFSSYWDYGPHGYLLEMIAEMVLNVVLFVPVGFLLGSGFQSMTWKKVLLTGCSMSVVIELIQLMFQRGFCEVDDVIHNTLGCLIGYGGYMMIKTLICHPWVSSLMEEG